MNEKKIIKAFDAMKALNNEEMKVFMFSANTYFKELGYDTEEEELDDDDIDKLNSDLKLAYAEHATTYRMIRKVFFGDAKIVYGVYADDAISFEDNDGEFLW